MQIDFRIAPAAQWRTDALLVLRFEDDPATPAWLAEAAPWAASSRALADFRAKPRTTAVAYPPDADAPVARVVAAGLGKRAALDLETLRLAVAQAVRACRDLKVASVGLALEPVPALPDAGAAGDAGAADAEAVAHTLEEAVTAALLGLYRFETFKSAPENGMDAPGGGDGPDAPEALQVLCTAEPGPAARAAVARAEAAAAGVYLARDLVNTPANVATPSFLAETAETLGREHGFKVRVIEADEAEGMGMGCFAAVFQGSPEPAKLIVIDAAPKGAERERPLVFVGKGVTFDTGGISIKPSAKMDEMKGDMAGAAAVLGFFEALGRLGAPRRVVGILPCTENMPGGAATRPGDVVTSYAGKTVEIVNTDAEGRLLLCDALTFAAEFDPLAVVDLATLTGACLVALGTDVAAVFSANDLLAESIAELGARVGDLYWRMPLWDRYFESLKSDVADMKNVGPREGGAVNAALFLKQFAPASAPWAHLDIAGPAFATTATALTAKGGTGFGVRTLLALVTAWEGAR